MRRPIGGIATAHSSSHDLPRLDVEYQLAPPLYLRMIGQYTATYPDSLRDDSRTNLPIFIRIRPPARSRGPSMSPATQFQGSFLFAYQPVPGTVAFLGYGNNLSEPQSLHLHDAHPDVGQLLCEVELSLPVLT